MIFKKIQFVSNDTLKRLNSLFILALFLPLLNFAQDSVSIENGKDYDKAVVSPILNELYKTNDLVISFRTIPGIKSDQTDSYFILTRKGIKMEVFNYLPKTRALKPVLVSAPVLELIWKTFVQNDLLKIKDEKDISIFCAVKYTVFNSHTHEFEILSKGKMKKLSYYDPEYYDNVCFGMDERKKIINSVSVINYALSESGK